MIIAYKKYCFSLKARETIYLPAYKGSTFRGGFGNSFKKVVCVFRRKYCQECPINKDCSYSYIFETPSPSVGGILNMNRYETIPHPFIIEPPLKNEEVWEAGTTISFNVILIGRATRYLMHFIMAFEHLGEMGLGRGRGKYELSKIDDGQNTIFVGSDRTISLGDPDIIEIPEVIELNRGEEKALKVNYITPTRLKYQRDYVNRIEFFILITNLLRRINLLHYYHMEPKAALWDHRLLIQEARKIIIKNDLSKWYDWERYSHRQRAKMKLGGVVGSVIYEGRINPFTTILEAGEILHVGKGTTFGLGMFILGEKNIKN